MKVKSDQSIYRNSLSYLHTPESFRETDTQLLSKLLLEELHKALSWQMQTLAEAAMEMQKLLEQLKETHPTATEAEQRSFITAAIPPKRRERFLSALQAGWKEAIKEFLDHSYLKVGIATLEEWKLAD
ncbi:hypothetical protein NDI39_17340 [Microcoleus sp. ZQ-A2]|nr:hypothetical protein [Microcoleus sp. FACHB-1]